MEKKELMFGEISAEELAEAQKTVLNVVRFIMDNKDSYDKDKKSAARAAMAMICLDQIMTSSIISSLAKEISDDIESEQQDNRSPRTAPKSISIPIPTGEKS